MINDLNIDNLSNVINEIKKYLNNSQRKQVEIENKEILKGKKLEFVIDRFEGEFALCESINDNKIINVKKEILPLNAKEGNVVKYDGNRYIIDFEKSKIMNKKIKKITDDLWEN